MKKKRREFIQGLSIGLSYITLQALSFNTNANSFKPEKSASDNILNKWLEIKKISPRDYLEMRGMGCKSSKECIDQDFSECNIFFVYGITLSEYEFASLACSFSSD